MDSIQKYLNKPPKIARFLRRFFSREDELVILDIGACEALDSIKYSEMFPKARVLAFEPLPANVEKIRSNLVKYGHENIVVIPEALSEIQGRATFFCSSGHPVGKANSLDWDYGNKSSSLLAPLGTKRTHPWLKFDEEIVVPVNTLKNVCMQHNVDSIDLIHMDVQGGELMVLKGAGDVIERIKLIWMEVEAIELYEGQPLKSEVGGFMRAHGFNLLVDTVGRVSGDQLWVSRSFYDGPRSGLRGVLERFRGLFD
ncbi:MAG TPA: FkbM family methyltransferase [Myxococcales bacterium]|nr:FkbM family methyltransferase [Myxococcales bacterium]